MYFGRKAVLKVVKTHYSEAFLNYKKQSIGLYVSVGHRSLVVLTLLRNSGLGLILIDPRWSPEQLLLRVTSRSYAERTVYSINRIISGWLDLRETYIYLQLQVGQNSGYRETELAKVDFPTVRVPPPSA
jgi:hypothetical protein